MTENTQPITILDPEAIKAALVEQAYGAEVIESTMTWIAAIEEAAKAHQTQLNLPEPEPKLGPPITCPKCKRDVVKELMMILHVPTECISLTKSGVRAPGIDIAEIHWSESHLVCRSCGWTNKPKLKWWQRLFQ